jgi:hypothetical protein
MLTDAEFNRAKESPPLALIHAVDEIGLVGEAMNGLIDLILDKGRGEYVRFKRQGVAQLLEPLLDRVSQAHSLVDHARKKLYPPAP